MVVFTFSVLDWKQLFLGKFGPKNQNCQFKLKFGIQSNLKMQSSVVVTTFAFLDRIYSFWANLVQKFRTVSLSRPRLFQYAAFSGDFHFFCFRWGLPFLLKFGLKDQNCLFKLKFSGQTNSRMQNSQCSLFYVLDLKYHFWANFVTKN